jgi:hypothetical protein
MRVQVAIVTTVISLGLAAAARAQVTGSFEGSFVVKRKPALTAAGTFTQVGRLVPDGTVVIGGAAADGAGVYRAFGAKATAKKLTFKGQDTLSFVKLTWTGKITGGGNTIKGKATVKGPGVKARSGTLTLTRNPPLPDGSSCDAVYTANQVQFDALYAQVLSDCTQCHAAGFQAQSTRFQVGDSLSTARSVASLVDSANPAGSRILAKPTNAVPHGGFRTLILAPGSDDEAKLRAWVDLVAAAACR